MELHSIKLTKIITNLQKLKLLLIINTLNMKVKENKTKICHLKNILILLDYI